LPRDSRLNHLVGITLSNPDDQADAEVAVRSRKIQMFTPSDGAVGIADQFPFETTVTWEKIPESDAAYEVAVWKANSTKGAPLGVTREDYYTVKFPEPGSYFIQISALDGRWQSNVHRMEISTSEAQLAASAGAAPPMNSPLILSLPPDDFTLVAIQVPNLFHFRWERPARGFPKREYEFVVADRSGKEIYRKKTGQEDTTFPVPSRGDYQWYVEAIGSSLPRGSLKRYRSEVRAFHVQVLGDLARGTDGKPTDPFAALFRSGAKGIFYVEGGI
jgi:hypothetical protein